MEGEAGLGFPVATIVSAPLAGRRAAGSRHPVRLGGSSSSVAATAGGDVADMRDIEDEPMPLSRVSEDEPMRTAGSSAAPLARIPEDDAHSAALFSAGLRGDHADVGRRGPPPTFPILPHFSGIPTVPPDMHGPTVPVSTGYVEQIYVPRGTRVFGRWPKGKGAQWYTTVAGAGAQDDWQMCQPRSWMDLAPYYEDANPWHPRDRAFWPDINTI